jgi:general secretion pathway protein D
MLWVILKADVATKSILINSLIPSHGDQAYDLLERLDVALEQVEVEVRLVELRYTSNDALGITMTINNLLAIDDGGAGGPGFTLSGGSSVLTSQPNNPSGSTLTLATLGRTRVNATLTMLAQFTDLRILTAPKITGLSGTPANITVGESFPYVSGTDLVTQPGGGNAATTQTVETDSAEIGFELNVWPTVTGDGSIELDLAPSLETRGESLVLFDAVGNPLQGEPIINTREATVRVRVKDGATLVIGGLLRRELNHAEGRTPLFGFIPGLAPLFTDKEESEITQNLLILVTARIIKED